MKSLFCLSIQGKCPGYYTGAGDEDAGIVVIQEWWGVNDQIKEQAVKWFNSKGFATVVPDLCVTLC